MGNWDLSNLPGSMLAQGVGGGLSGIDGRQYAMSVSGNELYGQEQRVRDMVLREKEREIRLQRQMEEMKAEVVHNLLEEKRREYAKRDIEPPQMRLPKAIMEYYEPASTREYLQQKTDTWLEGVLA
jgi:hypothetical protein